MQYSSQPTKFPLAFAANGNKRNIPENSQIGTNPGASSLTDGFPPACATPLAAGGIPPDILDINGILYEATAVSRWSNAGAGYTYDSAFATDTNVGGYPSGAQLLRSDGQGYWLNTVDNNTSNPDTGGSGWVSGVTYGQASIALTSGATTTLTAPQAGYKAIILTGALTSGATVVFPSWNKKWLIINRCTGNFSVTLKASTGSSVNIGAGVSNIYFDGTNMITAERSGTANYNFSIFTPTLSNTYTKTFTFLTPTNGYVIAYQQVNTGGSITPSVSITNTVSITGGATSSDTTVFPMNNACVQAVAGGVFITVTGTTTTAATGTPQSISTNLHYIFVPG